MVKNLGDLNTLYPFEKDDNGRTQLHYACQYEQLNVVEQLLQMDAEVNAADHWGMTPLVVSCIFGKLIIMKKLLEYNAEINCIANGDDIRHVTLLNAACINGKIDIVEFLLENNADMITADSNGMTPLHHATKRNFKEIIQLLLNKMNNIEIKDLYDKMPIDYTNDPDVIEMLKNHHEVCYL